MAQTPLKTAGSVPVNIGPDGKQRAAVAERLAKTLASTQVLAQKTLSYHWNVTGENFAGFHALFEAQYKELQSAADEIAERIRALGLIAPGTFREFAALSVIEEDSSSPEDARAMAKNLTQDNEALSKEAASAVKAAQQAGDEASADILIGRIAAHDKAAWMLRSSAQ
jgi:starvation-inducible DNA-binding protein